LSDSSDPRIGCELLGYHVEDLLGRGGMSVVYRASDPKLKRQVALKLIAPELASDRRFRERFLTESELAASLEHPAVVPIYDVGEVEGQIFLVMRLVEGKDLKALLRGEGRLEPERALAILSQVAEALDAGHAKGLVHRDVKPSNVLLDEKEHAYLADFGLARRIEDRDGFGLEARSLGSIDYVAPEQIRGEEVDGRADQYSLGCLLYECLAGVPPFRRGSDAATLFAHLEESPTALDGLERVMAKALAKNPEDRYQTCAELVADARTALGLERRRDRRPLAVAAVGLLLIGAALLAFFLARGDGPVPPAQGGRLLQIDPASNRLVRSVPVGDGAFSVAAGSGRVWVASHGDGTLWQLEPGAEGARKIPASGRPYAVTLHDGMAYVAATGPGQFEANLSTLDAVTGARIGGIGLFVCSLAGGVFGVWIAGCPNVQQLASGGVSEDPRIRATVAIPYARPLTAANFREALHGIAAGEGSVWVVGDASDRRLWRIDPVRHRITATIDLGFPPGGLAVGGGAVWVTDQLADRLVRIDPATNHVVQSSPVGSGAGGVTVGSGSVWVTEAIAHSVARVDPETNRVVATIDVPASPQAVAVGEGSLWVVGDAR
jgi:tRNA A-37 threonylcarbamoyl transferase component Bud32/streptogramin lyase